MKTGWEYFQKVRFDQKITKMKLFSILAFSTGALAQYNTCTDTARCDFQVSFQKLTMTEVLINDFQCSTPVFGTRESCNGNNVDLACCSETEACDLVNAETVACTDLPYLDNAGAARTCKFYFKNKKI